MYVLKIQVNGIVNFSAYDLGKFDELIFRNSKMNYGLGETK